MEQSCFLLTFFLDMDFCQNFNTFFINKGKDLILDFKTLMLKLSTCMNNRNKVSPNGEIRYRYLRLTSTSKILNLPVFYSYLG